MGLAALRIALVLLAVFMLSEAVLSVERTGLPYFVVMVDDSASGQVVDQYAEPAGPRGGRRSWPRRPGTPSRPGSRSRRACWRKTTAQVLAELQKQHKVRLYLVSTAARPLADVDKPEDVAPAVEKLLKVEANGGQSRLGSGVRQVLTELRGVPPSAIVLLTDGQTTDGEGLAKAAEFAARKGVPLYTIGLGDPEPARDLELSELLVDDVVFVDDLVRFQAKLLSRGFAGQQVTVRLKERDAELERPQVGAGGPGHPRRRPPRRPAPAGRDRPPPQADGRHHLHPRGRAPPPRIAGRQQPDRAHRQRPQGEAQGAARRLRAALRVPLPEELSSSARSRST